MDGLICELVILLALEFVLLVVLGYKALRLARWESALQCEESALKRKQERLTNRLK